MSLSHIKKKKKKIGYRYTFKAVFHLKVSALFPELFIFVMRILYLLLNAMQICLYEMELNNGMDWEKKLSFKKTIKRTFDLCRNVLAGMYSKKKKKEINVKYIK